jgi:uncharacterized protein YjiS (DUF1127 family)
MYSITNIRFHYATTQSILSVCQRVALCTTQHKEHEVMTGSVPLIALSPISQRCAPATHQVAAAKTQVRPLGTRKPAVVMVRSAWVHLQFINRVWRERRMLASLDDCALKDIGLNRADVERETGRSPLDLPKRRNRWE